MKKLNEKQKNDIWETIINPEIKKRGSFFLLLAIGLVVVATTAMIIGEHTIAMAAIIALLACLFLWFGNSFTIKLFYNQGEYNFVSLILNYNLSKKIWEYKELKKHRKLLLSSETEKERKIQEKKISLLKVWINQINQANKDETKKLIKK